jgi:Flp pilus assembly protein TadG
VRHSDLKQHISGGQAATEFALGAVALLMLMFVITDFRRAVYAYNFVSYAAREATRYAAVHGNTSPSPVSSSNEDPVKDIVLDEANGLDSTALTITPTWTPDNKPGSVVKVKVQYNFKPVSLFLHSTTLSLSATSQMVILH